MPINERQHPSAVKTCGLLRIQQQSALEVKQKYHDRDPSLLCTLYNIPAHNKPRPGDGRGSVCWGDSGSLQETELIVHVSPGEKSVMSLLQQKNIIVIQLILLNKMFHVLSLRILNFGDVGIVVKCWLFACVDEGCRDNFLLMSQGLGYSCPPM